MRSIRPPRDLCKRDFTAGAPGTKLVGDITYVATWAGWLCLATVIDCYSKQIIGYAMADHMRTELVTDALDMARRDYHLAEGCVFHSDRGSPNTRRGSSATDFAPRGLLGPMGTIGDCSDNSVAEAFFSGLQRELLYQHDWATRDQLALALFDWIETWYHP